MKFSNFFKAESYRLTQSLNGQKGLVTRFDQATKLFIVEV